MLNSEDFIKRLEILLDYYSLNASSFADKIGVQRSGMSHLLSGRNKPSLDFVMKISEVFPDINLYWILNGTDEFLKKNAENRNPPPLKIENHATPISLKDDLKKDLFQEIEKKDRSEKKINENAEIYKIVIFYKNGTFKDFVKEAL